MARKESGAMQRRLRDIDIEIDIDIHVDIDRVLRSILIFHD